MEVRLCRLLLREDEDTSVPGEIWLVGNLGIQQDTVVATDGLLRVSNAIQLKCTKVVPPRCSADHETANHSRSWMTRSDQRTSHDGE